jgi:hypothetical protein
MLSRAYAVLAALWWSLVLRSEDGSEVGRANRVACADSLVGFLFTTA